MREDQQNMFNTIWKNRTIKKLGLLQNV